MSSNHLRRGRCSIIGQPYVVTTATKFRHRWFTDPEPVSCVLTQFKEIEERGFVTSLAWVVMPDHLHWLLELRASTLDDVVRRLKSSSGLALNRMKSRRGAVWQAGYYDHAVRAEESLRRQAMYIMGNPVRAGLTEKIGEYPYAWMLWPMEGG